jgi:hypothetical protein
MSYKFSFSVAASRDINSTLLPSGKEKYEKSSDNFYDGGVWKVE